MSGTLSESLGSGDNLELVLGQSTSTADSTVTFNVDAILDLPYTSSATTSPVNALAKVIVRQSATSTTSQADGNLFIFKGNDSETELTAVWIGITGDTSVAIKGYVIPNGGVKGDSGADGADGDQTFLELDDTPNSFGTSGQILEVNSSADGFDFVDAPSWRRWYGIRYPR